MCSRPGSICAVTDVLPALSLIFEKPEANLLLRKPRSRQHDRLADWKLLLHAYFFLGLLGKALVLPCS